MALHAALATAGRPDPARFEYPFARKADVVDDYHGTAIADPYRWLEDADAPETRAWIAAEDKLTFEHLAKIPGRARMLERVTELNDVEKYTVPIVEGGRYFWSHNDGLQNQSVVYWGTSTDGPRTVLLDPNTLSKGGTVSVSTMTVSHDGRYLAYALSDGGSDWQEWHVREVISGKDLPDRLRWGKFSEAAFSPDNDGFFYSRFPAPAPGASLEEANYDHTLYFHRLGDPQERDEVVYRRPDLRDWNVQGTVTDDGSYLFISIAKANGSNNLLYYRSLRQKNAPILPLVARADAVYTPVAQAGSVTVLETNEHAPNGKLVRVDLRQPGRAAWKTFLPEAAEKLDAVSRVGDRFFFTYVKDAHARILTRDGLDPTAELHELPLPGIGTVEGFAGHPGDGETFWSYRSFTQPEVIYRYDLKSGASREVWRVHTAFDPSRYETKQVFYPSKDGTKVPMFLVAKKGLVLDGSNPTLLHAYGGFAWSDTPEFRPSLVMWMDMGGVYASANIRGGGEYGEAWHTGGTKKNKQNGLDDFIGAAEWLIAERYTSPARLAINGGSNGGLLVGGVEMQRPELFGACVADVGVMDMLRYHRFTIGHAWAEEYGTADDPAMFPVLLGYSPLHNVKRGTKYPPTLLTTSDHDDRVVPAHSFKLAAALQAAQAGEGPILIRIETDAGHAGGLPTRKAVEEATDRWAFIAEALGMAGEPRTTSAGSQRGGDRGKHSGG